MEADSACCRNRAEPPKFDAVNVFGASTTCFRGDVLLPCCSAMGDRSASFADIMIASDGPPATSNCTCCGWLEARTTPGPAMEVPPPPAVLLGGLPVAEAETGEETGRALCGAVRPISAELSDPHLAMVCRCSGALETGSGDCTGAVDAPSSLALLAPAPPTAAPFPPTPVPEPGAAFGDAVFVAKDRRLNAAATC